MKKLQFYILAAILFFLIAHLEAQNPTQSPFASKNSAASDAVTSKAIKPSGSVEEARNRFIALFNLYA